VHLLCYNSQRVGRCGGLAGLLADQPGLGELRAQAHHPGMAMHGQQLGGVLGLPGNVAGLGLGGAANGGDGDQGDGDAAHGVVLPVPGKAGCLP
jgi:hypothetical protein